MKNTILPVAMAFVLCALQPFSKAHAQSPGQIVRPAGGAGITKLNPNGDGYASATTSGFTTDDIAQSEVAYKVVPPAVTEPTGDLATGPSGGFSDIVKTVDNSGFYIYTGGTNLYFRLRIGSIISGSKGYSILIDTDNKMGNTGVNADPNYVAPTNTSNGNPGFEYEVVFRTNFDVTVYNVDGTSNPVAQSPTYALNTNSQISVALSTDGNNPDYFYDWYVPLSAIGNPTSIRLAATTVTSPSSALQGSRSDIYGIDDRTTSSVADAWTSVVNAEPSISLTNFSTYGSTTGAICTAAPTLNGPITLGSNVTVGGTWTRMDASKPLTATITLYKVSGGITTTYTIGNVSSGSNWSYSVPAVTNGDVFYAKALATGESQCLQSNNVTAGCSSYPAAPTITCASTKGIQGTIPTGTVNIYQITTTNLSTTATPLTTGLVYSGSSPVTFNYYGSNTQSGGACQGQQGIFTNPTTLMFVTNNGGCLSTPLYGCITGSGGNSTLAAPSTNSFAFNTPIYPYQTTISGTGTIASGDVLRLFVNDVYVTGYTASAAATTFTFSGVSLKTNDVLKVYVQSAASCMSVSPSTTVSCYNQPPVITTNKDGNIAAGSTTISGTATPNATITVSKNGTALTPTATANSSGAWSLSVPATVAGDAYTATATSSTCSTASQASAKATVASPTTCPNITFATSYTDASTSVTVNMTSFTGKVRLYEDGVLLDSSAALTNATTYTFTLPANTLYNNGVLTATAKGSTTMESTTCATQTISCASPLTPTITPTSSSITTGQSVTYNVSNVTNGAWYAIADNTSGISYGTSVYKTDANAFNLSTNTFSTAGNYTVKISADKLTGCTATLSTATIQVKTGTLAVRFLNSNARKQTDGIAISWAVADEHNVSHYEVERSYDCYHFATIAMVAYTAGSATNNYYNYVDKTFSPGNTICYRIKQVDEDGQVTYSAISSVKVAAPATFIQVVPNPARSHAIVIVQSETKTEGTLELLNLGGKQLYTKSISLHAGSNQLDVSNLDAFAAGVYLVRVITASDCYYQKLVIQ